MTSASEKKHPYLIAILAGGIFLRFFHLGQHSFWLDEFINFFDATAPFPQMHRVILASPPIYHYIVRCFYLLFGYSDFWLLVPSATFGSLLVLFTFFAAQRLFSREIALWATLLMAVSPMDVLYSQELRMYSLVPLLSLGSLFFWELAMQEDRPRDWLLYGLFSLLGMYTHNWFPMLVFSQGAWSVGTWISQKHLSRLGLSVYVGLGLLYLPWLPVLHDQLQKPIYNHMRPTSLKDILITVGALSGIKVSAGHSWVGVGTDARWPIVLFTTALLVYAMARNKTAFRIAMTALIIPFSLAFIISRFRPIYNGDRYTILGLPAYLIAISTAFVLPPHHSVRRVFTFLGLCWVGGCLFLLSHYYFHYQKAPWKVMHQYIQSMASPDDYFNISTLDYNSMAFRYYRVHAKEFTTWENVQPSAHVYIPIRNTDIGLFESQLPAKIQIKDRKNFGDFSVLTAALR